MNALSDKKLSPDKEYVVIKHPLKPTGNIWMMGLKFCNGYGVVVKNSKLHRQLLSSPLFRKSIELDLSFLQKAGFRSQDINLIWGKDVFLKYMAVIGRDPYGNLLEPEQVEEALPTKLDIQPDIENKDDINECEEETCSTKLDSNFEQELPELSIDEIREAHKKLGRCIFIKKDGQICKNKASKASPSGHYCFGHIKKDPNLRKE